MKEAVPLRVLFVEDLPEDAALAEHELTKGGLAIVSRCVETEEQLERALAESSPDVVISDFRLPAFDGLRALAAVRRRLPDVPFILFTGSLNEEMAVDCMKAGADDYILKDRTGRLATAVRAAIERHRLVRERRQLEEQLVVAQRMESVGRLAGGIAHDFNNLLGVIHGYGESLLRDLEAGDARHRKLEQILRAAERAAGLTRQLLAFSRRQIVQPRVLDLNAVVGDTERMLRHLIGEDVALLTTPDPDLARVKADAGQMEQVLMNLVVNARDAMPDGGRLALETRNAEIDEGYARRHPPIQPGRFVMLAVSDTGCGMDAATRGRVFEPFFTTKPEGKGTGLGLATVYGIVKQSGGFIWVYSEPGLGTTVKVYLPAVDEPLTAPRPRAVPCRGSETILLVEDQDLAREMMEELLADLGYRVLSAARGQEALDLVESLPETIALLLTDVVMPGMSGRTLAEQLTARRPEMRVLYMSGYTADIISQQGVLDEGVAFIEKPAAFIAGTLSAKLREVLDGPPAAPGKG